MTAIKLALPAILGFAATVVLGHFLIKKLIEMKAAQTIRDDGPASHLKKAGTPSMGGLMFLIPWFLGGIWFLPHTLLPLLVMAGYGGIGLYDDLDKRVINKRGGLAMGKKFILEAGIGLAAGLFLLLQQSREIGFTQGIRFEAGPVLFLLFILFFLLAVTNGVNFTDGLDGLLALVTLPVFLLFGFIALDQGKGELAAFAFVAAAGLLGFMLYNRHPARVFMGDTGSLAIGALIAAFSILLKVELLLLIFGLIYWIESLSVVLQVGYFKKTGGKRIFKMAPIHHHFELSGWKETAVVWLFSGASAAACLLAWVLYQWL